jgi:hypothetical protein|nr:hypothetical protein [uncultured Pseudoxanthomonas sp.]
MNAAPPAPQYLVQAGRPAHDRATVLGLWRGNLGQDARMTAKYEWFYLRCPHGEPLLQLLLDVPTQAHVGTASAGRRRLVWQGRELRGGVLVDLAVLPQHRSLGPALMLQQGLIAAAGEALDVLYGFPNPKAAPVFKRIGYAQSAHLVRYARVLRHAHYLRSRLPGWLASPAGWAADRVVALRDAWSRLRGPALRSAWTDQADARIDAVWADSHKGDDVMAVRDVGHLRWRFDESPLATTRYLLVKRARDRALQAWFAVQRIEGTLHVRDFWSLDGANGMAAMHVGELLRAARKLGCAAVSVEMCTSDAQRAGWQALHFVERGRRPVFTRWSSSGEPAAAASLFLTSADEDE